ncbi:NADH dehydrogenase FAD-containing subunit [Stackebrandtia albiflava]|uniref:NADH dehydrogenase FAD-containing subunit n=1 Tax=Stackebrandtia albiflava TaxID=406432 RepID=A0A562V476_9ACTN|nr:FAD-dependent oxidoreductase [Stackebrandtia albiflava]TWJ12673.1 NADH dehydrogenase FAD-containing subunit [Stackebrandtia albiflava]
MPHHILVLGAGYAGAYSAGYLARHLHPDDVTVTVVNAEPDFVERLRLHQVAAGADLPRHPLAGLFAGTGVRLRIGRVTSIDPEHRTVTVHDGSDDDRIGYDTLVFALGSGIADHGVPGVADHAFHVASRPAALRLHSHLDGLGDGGTVVVVGGGLTAIETATEIAESRRRLSVSVVTGGRLGDGLGPAARRHLSRACDRLGVTVHEHTTVTRVTENRVFAGDTGFAADATVWAAGFAVHPLAADSGLAVDDDGLITVDRDMRSVSHPKVFGIGDGALAVGDNGRPLPMSCATAGFTSRRATAAILSELTGSPAPKSPLAYYGNHISIGRRDGLFQLVDGDATPRRWALRGRTAAVVKAAILKGTVFSLRHPTFGIPSRRRRTTEAGRRAVTGARA